MHIINEPNITKLCTIFQPRLDILGTVVPIWMEF